MNLMRYSSSEVKEKLMSNLLFIYERDMPTIAATKDIFLQLDLSFGIRSDFMYLSDVKVFDIDAHEIIVFMRPNDILSVAMARRARESGHFVMTFCDDDLLHYNPMITWRRRGLKNTLKYSDVIWSPNDFIGNEYKAYTVGKRFAKIDTIVRPDQIEEIDTANCREKNRIKIVYAANPGHLSLFNDYAKEAVAKLIEKHGGQISFTFVGVRPDLSEYEDKTEIRYVRGMPLLEYRDFMAKEKFDIGIAPLADNRFTRCKYFNKYIEYTMSGICGIYSKVIPYTSVVKDGVTGLLAENTLESWLEKLETAVQNNELRTKCIIAAQDNLRECFTEKYIIESFKKQVPELVEYKKKIRACKGFELSKIRYYLLRLADWAYLGIYYLKYGGIKTFSEKWKIHFRERDAYMRKAS